MLLQPTQPMLVDVFQLLKCIKMNMVEEHANYIWVQQGKFEKCIHTIISPILWLAQ
jgi:hypothetical protein